MAGQPLKRAIVALIKERGGYTALFDRIGNGESLASLAREFGCAPSYLQFLFRKTPALEQCYKEARKASATAFAEKATDLVANVPERKNAIQKAKLQVDHYHWMAAAYDRETFGEQQGPQVSVTINDIHLEALRAQPRTPIVINAAPHKELSDGTSTRLESGVLTS